MSQSENLEIMRDFIAESRDMLDGLDDLLLHIEGAIDAGLKPDVELLHAVFRTFHSIKGAAAFLKLNQITAVSHEAESLLDLLRKERLTPAKHHTSLFFETGDFLKSSLDHIEEHLEDDQLTESAGLLSARLARSVSDHGSSPSIVTRDQQIAALESLLVRIERTFKEGDDKTRLSILMREDLLLVAQQFSALMQLSAAEVVHGLVDIFDRMSQKDLGADIFNIVVQVLAGLRQMASDLRCKDEPTDYGDLVKVLKGLAGDEGSVDGEAGSHLGQVLVDMGLITTDQLSDALRQQERPLGEILRDLNYISGDQLEAGLSVQRQKRMHKQPSRTSAIRVDIDKLDTLSNLMGEMIIAKNSLLSHTVLLSDHDQVLRRAVAGVEQTTRELQDLIMRLRMSPIDGVFRKMVRVVRDLSVKLDKKVDVELFGEYTELDKNVVEQLSSPLIHIIRNALDHGLETSEERLAAGKTETGTIRMEAEQEGGEVRLTITDDGRGINREKVLARAIERGLIASDLAADDPQVLELIMHPGFSTATKVTEVSGRGVGMDVVKKQVDSLNGRILIDSIMGQGTQFTLLLPLTMSIIEGMMVRSGEAIVTVPMLNIRETLDPQNYAINTDHTGEQRIFLRDHLYPLASLGEVLGFPESTCDDSQLVVMVEYGSRVLGLLVDEIIGQRQTVIKRAPRFFGDLNNLSGFSILPDGSITLILDVGSMINALV